MAERYTASRQRRVGAAPDPALPVAHRVVEQLPDFSTTEHGRMAVGSGFDDDATHITGLDAEATRTSLPSCSSGQVDVTSRVTALVSKPGIRPVHFGAMRQSAIVEARLDPHLEFHPAPYASDAAHQPMSFGGHGRVLDGHEVDQLGHAVLGEEAGDQDGRVGQVHLLGDDLVTDGRDGEASALLIIE